MTAKSDAFEQLVQRIHQALDGEEADVSWNDKVPDPDNPEQLRQIDVTVRRPGSLTIVECRIHQAPQDVTWIEELMGRRTSLNAELAIAVSSSGFSEGARRKAERYGIVLRDFASLGVEEVQNWGKQKKVHLSFLEFTDTVLHIHLPEFPDQPIEISGPDHRPIRDWRPLFRIVMNKLDELRQLREDGAAIVMTVPLTNSFFVNGVEATKVELSARVRRVRQNIELASLVAYADPLRPQSSPSAKIGAYKLGQSEIVESADRVVLVIDMSRITYPPDCFLDTIDYDHGRVVTVVGVKVIGAHGALNTTAKMRFRFSSP